MSALSETSSLVRRLSNKDGGVINHDWPTLLLVFAAFITFVVTAAFNGLNGSGAGLGSVNLFCFIYFNAHYRTEGSVTLCLVRERLVRECLVHYAQITICLVRNAQVNAMPGFMNAQITLCLDNAMPGFMNAQITLCLDSILPIFLNAQIS